MSLMRTSQRKNFAQLLQSYEETEMEETDREVDSELLSALLRDPNLDLAILNGVSCLMLHGKSYLMIRERSGPNSEKEQGSEGRDLESL